jgi:ribosomal protein S18 acetylase RimI-like enzyme
LLDASHLFDHPPLTSAVQRFLAEPNHHVLVAYSGGAAIGFVSGVELTHPDKGTEMFLYELAVDEAHRRRGAGTELVRALGELARSRGCYGMWVLADADNAAARAMYAAAGAAVEQPPAMFTWSFGPET